MTAYEITVLMCEYICRIKFLEIELLGQKKKKKYILNILILTAKLPSTEVVPVYMCYQNF